MDKIKKAVKDFNNENGNRNFTLKELIIYFNNERKEDVNEIKTQLANLPCDEHMTMYLTEMMEIKTTLRNVKKALVVAVPASIAIAGIIATLV